MREILFRGKRVDNGEWVYGFLYIDRFDEHSDYAIVNDIENLFNEYPVLQEVMSFQVDLNTIGQYTGLKDINGVEIYEGDEIIIEERYPFFDGDTLNYIGIVDWVYSGWKYILKVVSDNVRGISDGIIEDLNDCSFKEGSKVNYKIIGNIHDTKQEV